MKMYHTKIQSRGHGDRPGPPNWFLIFEGNDSPSQTVSLISYNGEVYPDYRFSNIRIPSIHSEMQPDCLSAIPLKQRYETQIYQREWSNFRQTQPLRDAFTKSHDVWATVRFGRFYLGFDNKQEREIPDHMPVKDLCKLDIPGLKRSSRPSDCELEMLDDFLRRNGFKEVARKGNYICTITGKQKVEVDERLERFLNPQREELQKLLTCDIIRLQSSDCDRSCPPKPDTRLLVQSMRNQENPQQHGRPMEHQEILSFAPDDDQWTDTQEPFRKIVVNPRYKGKVEYVRQKQMITYKFADTSDVSAFRRNVEIHKSIVKNYETRRDELVSTGILEHEVTIVLQPLPSPELQQQWEEIGLSLLEFALEVGDNLRVVPQIENPVFRP